MTPLLQVDRLQQYLGKKQILHDVDFQSRAGQITVILGPNGAGKTTLLKSVIGLYRVADVSSDGVHNRIMFDGQTINRWPIYKKVEAGLGYVPQQSSLFQQMSVHDNLALVYEYHRHWQGQKNRTLFIEERDRWLEHTKLSHTLKQMAQELSGGQLRKLEIVRALLMHPKLILFDEPFAGVDPKSIYELKSIFTGMAQRGIGIVISDHHVDQLFSIADMVYVILQGRVVTSGSIQDILNNKYTKDHYLGNQFYTEMAERFLE